LEGGGYAPCPTPLRPWFVRIGCLTPPLRPCASGGRKPFRCSRSPFLSRGASAFRLGSVRLQELSFGGRWVRALSHAAAPLVCPHRPPDADATLLRDQVPETPLCRRHFLRRRHLHQRRRGVVAALSCVPRTVGGHVRSIVVAPSRRARSRMETSRRCVSRNT
jgi:hypothetical protein